jgi:hypothetical protein
MSQNHAVCPACGSDELAWSVELGNHSGVSDGKLCMRDISAYLLLGCNECSATVRLIDADSNRGLELLARIGREAVGDEAPRAIVNMEPL